VKPAFLGVERSLKGQRWFARLEDQRLAEAIAQRHDLPEIIARVLAAREVPLEEAEAFLNPTLRTLMPQPSALRDMEKGADRLAQAIISSEKIGIISDYDVDGVTSAALLSRFLLAVGSSALVYIPDRVTEGYGPSEKAVAELKANDVSLLLTLDCGVLSHDPLAHAATLGLTTIIVDHHQASADLPEAHAVINPNRQDDVSGLGHLCAAGVVMILIATVNKALRTKGHYNDARPEPNMLQWLEFVALATVCDVVPLKGLNRAYVTQGLKVMARRENLGLAALAEVAGLKRRADPYALGFVLGPRINAAGRVGHAHMAFDLLMAHDRGAAYQLAHKLEEMNRKRQAIERHVVEGAVLQAEAALGQSQLTKVIIATGEHWHPGVVGLAATRLKERFHRPSFALAVNPATGLATGSGRSVNGVNMGRAVRAALDLNIIEKGGGHGMAAGLTLKISELANFRQLMEDLLGPELDAQATQGLAVDGALTARGATLDLIELLEQAGPYGAAHAPPIFVFPAHRIAFASRVGNDHVKCVVQANDGTRLKAIAFRAFGTDLGEFLMSERQSPVHIAARLVANDWNGKRETNLQIEDVAVASIT
jgi:single-stranded-DNA-specific exonuclease